MLFKRELVKFIFFRLVLITVIGILFLTLFSILSIFFSNF
jgi:hypothetical protein